MRVQKYNDYYTSSKNKYILKPIVNKEPYIYYKHYCIDGVVDWDFNPSAKRYTEPAKDIIKYSHIVVKTALIMVILIKNTYLIHIRNTYLLNNIHNEKIGGNVYKA